MSPSVSYYVTDHWTCFFLWEAVGRLRLYNWFVRHSPCSCRLSQEDGMTFHMESTEWYFQNTWLKNILRGRDPTLLVSSYPYTSLACSNVLKTTAGYDQCYLHVLVKLPEFGHALQNLACALLKSPDTPFMSAFRILNDYWVGNSWCERLEYSNFLYLGTLMNVYVNYLAVDDITICSHLSTQIQHTI